VRAATNPRRLSSPIRGSKFLSMKILHVVALIQASTGGPAVSVTRLASEQAKLGHEVTLACLDYPHLGPQVAAPEVRVVSVKGNVFAVRGRGWCPEFRRVVREEAAKADIVHNHGLWMWPNAYARKAAVAAGKPLVISPRGMLEAWSLQRSKLRKAVAWWLFEKRNLQSAVMFHATAASEARSIEESFSHRLTRIDTDRVRAAAPTGLGENARTKVIAWGPSTARTPPVLDARGVSPNEDVFRLTNLKLKTTTGVPVVVAANGVDLPDLERRPGREVLEEKFLELRDRRWVVFMSRLHPKKGIDVLLRAWARQKEVTSDVWREPETAVAVVDSVRRSRGQTKDLPVLVLAGSDLIAYRKEVEKMVRELGLEESVVMTGEVQGEMKDALLANAEVFVLPSYSENFGIVVAEAMAWGRPVIASTGTPWQEVAEVRAGWWVAPEEGALSKALTEALGKGREELEAMGAKGRALVEQRYTWAAPAAKLVRAYEEALATAERSVDSMRRSRGHMDKSKKGRPRINADGHG
jgi:glycosyltransferase involved in cell wall biosynthesis